MNNIWVTGLIRRYLDEEGSEGLAKRLGVTRQHIWSVLVGKSKPGPQLLEALGLTVKMTIVRIKPARKPYRSVYIRASQRAHQIVCRAIKSGQLPNLRKVKTKCADCGRRAKQYDHRDYSKPLDVTPVCQSCNLKRGPGVISKNQQGNKTTQ